MRSWGRRLVATTVVSSAPHDGRFAGHHPRRRRRRAPLPADEGTGQARRVLRRALPDHRFHAVQLRELGLPPHLHRHPVQVALALAAHSHGLEGVRRGARRIHRDPAAAEARRRALVPRHRRRRLPEPLLDQAREPEAHRRALGRSRLQDGLRAHAALPPGARRSGHHRLPRGPGRGGHALRRRRRGRHRQGHRFPGEAATADRRAGIARRRAGLDGHLRLRGRRALPGARG